ncbi:hypothetical protein [Marinobacter mobilis]|uniref:hypothetical protein n=1 Tax=Marinobacter mobilis TaxID=488533 RepID=UPI001587D73A|nr:hypothetical protein [Marinobacter mobilis]
MGEIGWLSNVRFCLKAEQQRHRPAAPRRMGLWAAEKNAAIEFWRKKLAGCKSFALP